MARRSLSGDDPAFIAPDHDGVDDPFALHAVVGDLAMPDRPSTIQAPNRATQLIGRDVPVGMTDRQNSIGVEIHVWRRSQTRDQGIPPEEAGRPMDWMEGLVKLLAGTSIGGRGSAVQDRSRIGTATRSLWRTLSDMATRGRRKPVREMRADHAKLVDIAMCLITWAEARGVSPSRHQLLDALFLADVAHMNEARRPISFDSYEAREAGPAAATFDAMLDGDPDVLCRTAMIAWSRRPGAQGGADVFHAPRREVDEARALSPSDVRILRSSMDRVLDVSDGGPGATTRSHVAYRDARSLGRGDVAPPMDYALFYDVPNDEEAHLLSFISRHRA